MSTPPPLSTWARNVAPSPTLAVDAKAKALKAAGEDVCGFGAGEPDFDTPEFIKDACVAALKAGKTKYAPTPGIDELRSAIAARYGADYGLKVAPGQVVVSPGGKFSCYLAILATCNPGDEVIIPAPYWVSYPEMVKLAGAAPKFVLAGDSSGFRVTAAQIEVAITPRTNAIVAVDKGGNMAAPLLAEVLGGKALLGFIAAVAFATILAVVAGLTLSGAAYEILHCASYDGIS